MAPPRPLVSSSPASDEVDDLPYSYRRRSSCCFCLSPSGWHRISPDATARNRRWWKWGWNRVHKWSDLVAGPARWKTFLRRFNRRRGSRKGDFRYDPLSYAKNFDQGPGGDGRDFCCRYASFSRDYGGVDGTNFT